MQILRVKGSYFKNKEPSPPTEHERNCSWTLPGRYRPPKRSIPPTHQTTEFSKSAPSHNRPASAALWGGRSVVAVSVGRPRRRGRPHVSEARLGVNREVDFFLRSPECFDFTDRGRCRRVCGFCDQASDAADQSSGALMRPSLRATSLPRKATC